MKRLHLLRDTIQTSAGMAEICAIKPTLDLEFMLDADVRGDTDRVELILHSMVAFLAQESPPNAIGELIHQSNPARLATNIGMLMYGRHTLLACRVAAHMCDSDVFRRTLRSVDGMSERLVSIIREAEAATDLDLICALTGKLLNHCDRRLDGLIKVGLHRAVLNMVHRSSVYLDPVPDFSTARWQLFFVTFARYGASGKRYVSGLAQALMQCLHIGLPADTSVNYLPILRTLRCFEIPTAELDLGRITNIALTSWCMETRREASLLI